MKSALAPAFHLSSRTSLSTRDAAAIAASIAASIAAFVLASSFSGGGGGVDGLSVVVDFLADGLMVLFFVADCYTLPLLLLMGSVYCLPRFSMDRSRTTFVRA